MPPTDVSPSGRIFGLDLFRAVAIMLVVLRHGGIVLELGGIGSPAWLEVIDGVDLFFVLSGFLIGTILLKEMHREEGFTTRRLVLFWKRRWFRTLPAYYLILAVNVVLVRSHFINGDFSAFNLRFLVFLQNFNKPFTGFFWESWSLSVEEWFYLLTPLMMILLLRMLPGKWSFLSVTALMLAAPLILRYHRMDPGLDSFWGYIIIGKVVLTRLDSIAYGLLAAWACYHYRVLWDKLRIPTLLLAALVFLLIAMIGPFQDVLLRQVLIYSLIPFAAMLLLPAANALRDAKGPIAAAVTHISKISYSMYLINLALVAELIRSRFPPTDATDAVLKYVLFWAVVVALASLLYRYFELPMMRLRERRWFV
ncbi:MAG: acyltransferase [Flavobacteriales bacterium]